MRLFTRQLLEVLVPVPLVARSDEFLRGNDRDQWLRVRPGGCLGERSQLAILGKQRWRPVRGRACRTEEGNAEKRCGPDSHRASPAGSRSGHTRLYVQPRKPEGCPTRTKVSHLGRP